MNKLKPKTSTDNATPPAAAAVSVDALDVAARALSAQPDAGSCGDARAQVADGVLPPLPIAFFDEFGRGADDRVQDYARAALAARQPVGVEPVAKVRQDGGNGPVVSYYPHTFYGTKIPDGADLFLGHPAPAAVPVDALREPLLRLISAGEYLQNRILSTNGANCVDQFEAAINAAKSALATHPQSAAAESFQAGVSAWMGECFLPSLYSNMTERGDRLLEEVLELLQSNGYDPARVQTLVQYVYGRPVGDPAQEVGGVMVTLAAYCWVAGLDMHAEGVRELARITQPEVMAKIRRKQEAKNALHFDTPLPGGAPAAVPVDGATAMVIRDALARAIGCGYAQGHRDTEEGEYVEVRYEDRTKFHGELADDLLTGDRDFASIAALATHPQPAAAKEQGNG